MIPELVTPLWLLGLVGLAAYALGSIPFGVVIARVMGLGDLRAIGSGNIGATNVMRTGNKAAGVATFVLDAAKGAVAALLAGWLIGPDAAQVAALAAFIGHLYPVYLGFKGGKGVATFIGITLALAWPVGLATCATWLVTFKASRYSSLAGLTACGMSSIYAGFLGYLPIVAVLVVAKLLVFYKHRDNIKRLWNRTEPRFKKAR
ncbi:MAG: acyl-phosphate glycerol 3-phosphate acyltransferase PlsY [Roseibaca calidilacus]|uniref:Glycerol-3-phosphate acyltransferase n=1 Tax=Roseibaca calidilacus TaxID=1666912 RepID=A0A0P7WJA5_9RHOB|nr:MAG: acyl-phosphate glycerol 3-phosphate acyltransferase PlsY [Roseibaca calidilacus]CUX83462.1 acyl-phosphate glycerol-3-phosphate acyltransferase [Roseibaca calidilacus]